MGFPTLRGDTCQKKYLKKVRNNNYEIYCLHCNFLTEPGVVGEGDRGRIRQRRLTRRPAEALEPSQSICFWISTKRNSRCSVWEQNQTKKNQKNSRCFPFRASSLAPSRCKWLFAVPSHIVRILMDANCFGNWRGNGQDKHLKQRL